MKHANESLWTVGYDLEIAAAWRNSAPIRIPTAVIQAMDTLAVTPTPAALPDMAALPDTAALLATASPRQALLQSRNSHHTMYSISLSKLPSYACPCLKKTHMFKLPLSHFWSTAPLCVGNSYSAPLERSSYGSFSGYKQECPGISLALLLITLLGIGK